MPTNTLKHVELPTCLHDAHVYNSLIDIWQSYLAILVEPVFDTLDEQKITMRVVIWIFHNQNDLEMDP